MSRGAACAATERGAWSIAPWVYGALLAALVVAAFAVSLRNGFLHDDGPFIVQNEFLHNSENLSEILTSPDAQGTGGSNPYYRPVTTLTFLADNLLWKGNAAAYHAVNLGLHLLTVLLLFALAREFVSLPVAFVAAALFAVHPAHSEPVAYVSARADLLCGLFMICALWSHVRRQRGGGAGMALLAVVSTCLAIFSKIVGVILPVLIFLHLWQGAGARRAFRASLPHFGMAALFAILREVASPMTVWGTEHDWTTRLATGGVILRRYLENTFLPWKLMTFYEIAPRTSFATAEVLSSWLIVLAAGALSFYLLWRSPAGRTGLFWYVGALVPVSGIPALLFPTAMADRYLYIPLIGMALAVAAGLEGLLERLRGTRALAPAAACALVLMALSATASAHRTTAWRDPLSFWGRATEDNPSGVTARRELAVANMQAHRFEEAEADLQVLRGLGPDPARFYSDLAFLRLYQGRLEEAQEHLNVSFQYSPMHLEGLVVLGLVAGARGDVPLATAAVNQVLNAIPTYANALYVKRWLDKGAKGRLPLP